MAQIGPNFDSHGTELMNEHIANPETEVPGLKVWIEPVIEVIDAADAEGGGRGGGGEGGRYS
jgi:hypothetical protein